MICMIVVICVLFLIFTWFVASVLGLAQVPKQTIKPKGSAKRKATVKARKLLDPLSSPRKQETVFIDTSKFNCDFCDRVFPQAYRLSRYAYFTIICKYHCRWLVIILVFPIPILIAVRKETADFLSIFEHFGNIFATFQLMKCSKNGCQNHWHLQFLADQLTFFQPVQ